MSSVHSQNSKWMLSPFKIMLGKLRNRYQAYCTRDKTHAMDTCHGGTGCPLDRDIDLHVEDTETTGLENNNESTGGSDDTVALEGPEAEGYPDDLTLSNQARLTEFTREINDLCQWVEEGEGKPAESQNCIEWELQNLSLEPHPPPPPTPTEPFGEVTHQYTDTLCTIQKQANLTISLLQDISDFKEYDSTKLEDCLMDIETAADLTNESQAKIAKAKSREFTHTLVKEAINSDKSWEEIKYILWLKLMFHAYPTVGKGIPCSIHPQV